MKCRRLLKRLICYGCVHLSTFLPVLLTAFLDIFNDNFDGSAYNLPFNAVVPFDLESISGSLLAWFYQLNECFSYLVQMITTTAYFSSFCCYIMAMCGHFNWMIDSIHLDSQQIQMQKSAEKRHQMWLNVRAEYQRAIGLHIDIYE